MDRWILIAGGVLFGYSVVTRDWFGAVAAAVVSVGVVAYKKGWIRNKRR